MAVGHSMNSHRTSKIRGERIFAPKVYVKIQVKQTNKQTKIKPQVKADIRRKTAERSPPRF